jgi:hypothetical protein
MYHRTRWALEKMKLRLELIFPVSLYQKKIFSIVLLVTCKG